MYVIAIILSICFVFCRCDTNDQLEAVKGLISRVLGSEKYLDSFDLKIDEQYPLYFEVYPSNGKIGITSSTAVGLSSGFHYYVRYILEGSVTWETRNIPLEDFPVIPKEKVTKRRLGKYNYMFNVCTFGYTMTSWGFPQWERLIDWMALHGVNLPLAFVGQEYVWYKTFENFGISLTDMLDFFSGPHFLPWNRMGNIQRWGGPLTEEFLIERFELQKKLLERMRSLGMSPVLPGFGGFVPPAFVNKFPNVRVTKSTTWNHFNSTYTGTYLLDALDPIFSQLGKTYYETLTSLMGTDHFYNADTFNEMDPTNGTLTYLKQISKAVYDPMREVDPHAVWIKQGWAFLDSRAFWTNERIEAYLSSIPDESMIILDLYSEIFPFWKDCDSYFKKPFIWNMLKSFGGHRAFFGDINHLAESPISDYFNTSSSMVGIGITSEAIYLPPLPFELFMDVYLQEKPMGPDDVDSWINQFIRSRYGESNNNTFVAECWNNLRWGPFASDVGTIHHVSHLSVLEEFPQFGIVPVTNGTVFRMTANAFRSIVKSGEIMSTITDGYAYDYVDIVRQFLSNLVVDLYSILGHAYSNKLDSVSIWADEILDVLKLLDRLLLTNEHFLLGTWIADARNLGHFSTDKDLYEFDARNQVTLWGPLSNGVGRDYARKQWSGLIEGYYFNRWKIFLDDVVKGSYDTNRTKEKIEQFEVFWQTDFKTTYPSKPEGDTFLVGEEVLRLYGDELVLEMYEVVKNVDSPGNDIGKTVTDDIITLATLCNLDKECTGFNTNGWIKTDVESRTTHSVVDLYVKK